MYSKNKGYLTTEDAPLNSIHRKILTTIMEHGLWEFEEGLLHDKYGIDHSTLHKGLRELVDVWGILGYKQDERWSLYKINKFVAGSINLTGAKFHFFPGERDLVRSLINLDIRSMTTIANSSGIKTPNLSKWTRSKGALSAPAVYDLMKTLGIENFTHLPINNLYNTIDIIPILAVNRKNLTDFNKFLFYYNARIWHDAYGVEPEIIKLTSSPVDNKTYFLLNNNISAYDDKNYYCAIVHSAENIIGDILERPGNTLQSHSPHLMGNVNNYALADIIKSKLFIPGVGALDDFLNGKPDPFRHILDRVKSNSAKEWKDVRSIAAKYGLSAEDIYECINREHCSRHSGPDHD